MSDLEKIVHIQNITPDIKIQDIHTTYSKAGFIEKIILSNTEALVFFSESDDAESSLLYENIGDIEVECQISTQDTIHPIVEQIDYLEIARQKSQLAEQQAQLAFEREAFLRASTLERIKKQAQEEENEQQEVSSINEISPLQQILSQESIPEINKNELEKQGSILSPTAQEESFNDKFEGQASAVDNFNASQPIANIFDTLNNKNNKDLQEAAAEIVPVGEVIIKQAKDNFQNIIESLPEAISQQQQQKKQQSTTTSLSTSFSNSISDPISSAIQQKIESAPVPQKVTQTTSAPSSSPTAPPSVQKQEISSSQLQGSQNENESSKEKLNNDELLNILTNTILPSRVRPGQNDLFLNVKSPKYVAGVLGVLLVLLLLGFI